MKSVRQYLIYIFILFVWFLVFANDKALAIERPVDLWKDVSELRIVPLPGNQLILDNYIKIQKWEAGFTDQWPADLSFWNKYEVITNKLQTKGDLWWQVVGGFVNFNTILFYLAYLIRVISNIAIAIAALFIIRWGYEYVMQTFLWDKKTTTYITNIVIWIFVMAFAYGIIRILAFTFLN